MQTVIDLCKHGLHYAKMFWNDVQSSNMQSACNSYTLCLNWYEVYVDYVSSSLSKSYDQKRGKVYTVTKVDTTAKPWIYQITDIMDRKAKG